MAIRVMEKQYVYSIGNELFLIINIQFNWRKMDNSHYKNKQG
jgi:hypothetical protein